MMILITLIFSLWLIPYGFGIDCNSCSIYNRTTRTCRTTFQQEISCDGDYVPPLTVYRETNNQWDLISIGEYLGDINMLNHNFDLFFPFANASMYWTKTELDDEISDITLNFDSLVNIAYQEEEQGEIGFVSAIYTISMVDLNYSMPTNFSFIHEELLFNRTSDLLFTISKYPDTFFSAFIYLASCNTSLCYIEEWGTKDSFSVKEMLHHRKFELINLQNPLDFKNVLNSKSAKYGRYYLKSQKDIDLSKQNFEDFVYDIKTTQESVSINFLQQIYFLTLEMVSTIELQELEDQDIYYEDERTLVKLNQQILDIQNRIVNMPIIQEVKFSEHENLNVTSFVSNEIDVFCTENFNSYYSVICNKTLYGDLCMSRNYTQIQIPKRKHDYFETEIEINGDVSILFRSKTEFGSENANIVFSSASGYDSLIETNYYTDAYMIYHHQVFLIAKNSLGNMFDIDDLFKFKFIYNRYHIVAHCDVYQDDDNCKKFSQKYYKEPIEMVYGHPKPVQVQTQNNIFYGLELTSLTEENHMHILHQSYNPQDQDEYSYIYNYPSFITNKIDKCDKTYLFNESETKSLSSFWLFDPNFGDSYIGAISRVDVPNFETVNMTFEPQLSSIAHYQRQSLNDQPISLYTADNNDIINYLLTLDNEVDDLREEIVKIEQVLEEITKPQEPSFWDYFNDVMSIIDLADLAVNIGKNLVSITRNAIRFMKASFQKVRNVAVDFGHSLQYGKALKGIYNPIESINSGTVYNYLSGYKPKKFDYPEKKVRDIFENANIDQIFDPKTKKLHNDIRILMSSNSAAYAAISKRVYEEYEHVLKSKLNFDFNKTPFGEVSVHKSPIDILQSTGSKFISDNFPQKLTSNFLSNKCTKYPFHTSFSSFNFEMDFNNKAILVKRYGGISEASTVGPTNVKNPKVKIGIVKFEYELLDKDIKLKNWKDTEKQRGIFYTENDIDQLYKSFVSSRTYNKNSKILSTNNKWDIIHEKASKKYLSRNVIDSSPVSNPLYMKSLDRFFDYNTKYNGFNYNLWNKNCQSFCKSYASLASKGVSAIKIKDSNYQDFINGFAKDFEFYNKDLIANDYYVQQFKIVSSDNIVNFIFMNK